MTELKLVFLNNSFGRLETDTSTLKNLYEEFSFFVPGYRFMPKYRQGIWDGKIHLINIKEKLFPVGLTKRLIRWGKENNAFVECNERLRNLFTEKETDEALNRFFSGFRFWSGGNRIHPREDQLYAVRRAIRNQRAINICPTSFGKSLSIFMEVLWQRSRGRKSIIVVPTTDLVLQFRNDIEDYCTRDDGKLEEWFPVIQTIYAGQTKEVSDGTELVITTWQSIHRLPPEWINQFDCLILDEAHKGSATCIRKVFEEAVCVSHRSGWTGSLEEEGINALQAESLIGEIEIITDTRTLMDNGYVAQLNVVFVRLLYSEELRKLFQKNKVPYEKEIAYLEGLETRSRKIIKIANQTGKTGLILFSHKKHGEHLYRIARKLFPEKNVYLVHGTSVLFNDEKHKTYEEMKQQMEQEKDAIFVCSYGKFSTGVSIKNIHWLIFASPTKSYVRLIQSIGRSLRISKTKHEAMIFDLVDDLSSKTKRGVYENYSVRHFRTRFGIITGQKLQYTIQNLPV